MSEFEKINLDDYIQTGEGGSSLTYNHKNGKTLAKLFKPGFEADRAKEDFLTSSTVYELGIPTPKPYRLLTDGSRFGAEYELIQNKRSLSRIIADEPERLNELSVTLARMVKKIHSTKADTSRIKSMKEKIRQFYLEKDLVPEDYKIKALQFIERVPDTPMCLHGDSQLSNVITDGKRTLWIDVGDFGYGVPEWDLCLLWSMTHYMDASKAEYIFHLKPETLRAHWDIFISSYLETTDKQRIEEFEHKILPFTSAKLPYIYDTVLRMRMPDIAFQHLIKRFG